MSSVVDSWAEDILRSLDARGLRRHLEPLESPVGATVRLGGRTLINFSSNDYLGLANDRDVVAAARLGLAQHGVGSGASRLIVGDTTAHHALEKALAAFEGTQAALLFNSGYAANVGTLAALFGPEDVLFSDELNHASLIDGCRLSRAKVVVFAHRDVEALSALVRANPGRRRAVVTDTVFSMDGDVARLHELRSLCDREGLALMVDEAHGTGVLGATGRGLCEVEGVHPDIHVGTLSKSFGVFGAYVCGSTALREVLLNAARSFVFSTALPAALCTAALVALEKLREPSLRDRLARHRAAVADAFHTRGESAIFSLVLGTPQRALGAAARLREQGLLVKAIRPPTVPEGTSRLRVSLSAAHQDEDVRRLIALTVKEMENR